MRPKLFAGGSHVGSPDHPRADLRPAQPGGQQDFDVCTGKTKNTPSRNPLPPVTGSSPRKCWTRRASAKPIIRWRAGWTPLKPSAIWTRPSPRIPKTPSITAERGFQYHRLKDYDRALSEYEKALALNPDSSYAYGVRAFTLEQKGDVAGALADLDRAIAIEPQEPAYYTSKAEIYLRQGATSEALAALEQGLKVNPDYADFYNVKAEVYRKIGDAEGELAALNRLIELKPTHQYGLLLRALTYERLGRLDLAIADYDALLALDPDGKFYRERRAALLKARDESAAPPVPAVVVGDAPGKARSPPVVRRP